MDFKYNGTKWSKLDHWSYTVSDDPCWVVEDQVVLGMTDDKSYPRYAVILVTWFDGDQNEIDPVSSMFYTLDEAQGAYFNLIDSISENYVC